MGCSIIFVVHGKITTAVVVATTAAADVDIALGLDTFRPPSTAISTKSSFGIGDGVAYMRFL